MQFPSVTSTDKMILDYMQACILHVHVNTNIILYKDMHCLRVEPKYQGALVFLSRKLDSHHQ